MKLRKFFMGIFPALVLFLFIPFSLYTINQSALYPFHKVLLIFLGILGLWVIFVSFLLRSRTASESRIFIFLMYVGIFFVFKDILWGVKTNGIIGLNENVKILVSGYEIFGEILLLLLSFALASRLKETYQMKVFLPFVLIFSLLQTVTLGYRYVQNQYILKNSSLSQSESYVPRTEIKAGNVYLICLDMFVGKTFKIFIEKNSDLKNEFTNFVYFPNNRSNYTFTWPSLASVMSGSFHGQGQERMRDWYKRALTEQGLLKDFSDNGYTVWQYAGMRHPSVTHQIDPSPNISKGLSLLTRLWIIRVSPLPIRKNIYESLFHKDQQLESWVLEFYNLFNRLIDDENNRNAEGQMVYAHIYFPHFPPVVDECCHESHVSDMAKQHACAVKLLVKFIKRIKERGGFDRSTIIVFSDHGVHMEPTNRIYDFENVATKDRIIEVKSSALLLIKPPYYENIHEEPLKISEKITQNIDIPAILKDLTGIPFFFREGTSVFSGKELHRRDIRVYDGFEKVWDQISKSDASLLPSEIKSDLDFYLYSPDKHWSHERKVDILW